MPLPLPNLDDRDFDQLLEEARRQIQQSSPEWTDLSPGDPGMVILELFAHLTETMLYRLNRLPEKAYVAFLNLIGVHIHPPAAAGVRLRFSRGRAADVAIEIPRGTRVAASRQEGDSDPVTFVTARAATIAAGKTAVEVLAHHCELIEGEIAGIGTGLPGLHVEAQRPPIVAPTGSELDLIVGVEMTREEADRRHPDERVTLIQHRGRVYQVWHEVETFANLRADRSVYIVDRMSGVITFAPAARMRRDDGDLEPVPRALAAIPPAGREIRLWYRRGGGPEGNVAAGTLTVLKDTIPGVDVTNPEPATGGQAAETLENALVRGPQELHSLHRAVTARDFELVALYGSRAVARAQALTLAALWTYATPGTAEVLLVPHIPEANRGEGRVTAATLRERETEVVRSQIQRALDQRRPLGTNCVVNWTRYKTVRVAARIVVHRQEDRLAIRRRVLARLHQTINPLPTQFSTTGWPFGQALRASHIYDIALAEPGVLWVDRVRLLVEDVPGEQVTSVAADAFQPRTWYAGSGARLFRSLDDGDGWELAGDFDGERFAVVRTHPQRAGMVAAVMELPNAEGSRIYISRDCGESWESTVYTTAFEVNDAAWILRDETPVLLLATDTGLYELVLRPGGSPVQVLVSRDDPDLGFYDVVASRDLAGQVSVSVAAQGTDGVFLSSEGGRSGSFRHIGLRGEDIRALAVQYDGPRSFLWAGSAAAGGADGKGCFRWELRGMENPPEGWESFSTGWEGGSCRSLAFLGTLVVAGTHHAGVQWLDVSAREPTWKMPDVRCGLPMRDPGRFHPVDTVATDPGGRLVMAGGVEGVYRSRDEGISYESCSKDVFLDKVTLPPTWLFCSGDHDLTVETEDEAERD
ncbi:MAG: putative baseplate assembly protein [Anaerolineae bacterium]